MLNLKMTIKTDRAKDIKEEKNQQTIFISNNIWIFISNNVWMMKRNYHAKEGAYGGEIGNGFI